MLEMGSKSLSVRISVSGTAVNTARRTSARVSPRERSEPTKRLARERVGECRGAKPLGNYEATGSFCGRGRPARGLAAVFRAFGALVSFRAPRRS